MDDVENTLSNLKKILDADSKIVSSRDLNKGDIIEANLLGSDGLVLKDGYTSRRKFLVIIGKTNKGDYYGFFLINSKLPPCIGDNMEYQYLLRKQDYPELLDYDSWLDCTDIMEIKSSKIIPREAKMKTKLKEQDLERVLFIAANNKLIKNSVKKKYNLMK